MGRPLDRSLLILECPYCHSKSKYAGYEPRRFTSPPSFFFCPACKFAIGFRDKPTHKPSESNQSWETRLVEYVMGYRPSDKFDPEWLALPTLYWENSRNILKSKQYKPDAEQFLRRQFWIDYTSNRIYRNFTHNFIPKRKSRWIVIRNIFIEFLQRVKILWSKEPQPELAEPISDHSLDYNKIESVLAFWKANLCTDLFYQKFENVILQEAEKLWVTVNAAKHDERLREVLRKRIAEFNEISEFSVKMLWRLGFKETHDSIKKTQGGFESSVGSFANTLFNYQWSNIGENTKPDTITSQDSSEPKNENEENLERLLQLAITDADRLEIYQQLGRFKEAEELFDHLMQGPAMPDGLSPYHHFYNEEMRKRIKGKNRRPFIIEDSFVVRDKKRETKANLERMLKVCTDESDKLDIYQQLGKFKEATELRNSIVGSRYMANGRFSSYESYYYEEMLNRIERKDKRPFVLEEVFVVLDAK